MSDGKKRLFVICGDNRGSRIVLDEIGLSNLSFDVTVILTQGIYYKRSFVSSVWKIARESSLIFALDRFRDLIKFIISGNTVKAHALSLGFKVIETYDINSGLIIDMIRNQRPSKVYIFNSFHILGAELIASIPDGIVGFHPSLLPGYRGLEPFFWVLANEEKQTGISLFRISEFIDRGEIIFQQSISLSNSEKMSALYEKLNRMGGFAIKMHILDSIPAERKKPDITTVSSGYFPMPTRESMKRFRQTDHRL